MDSYRFQFTISIGFCDACVRYVRAKISIFCINSLTISFLALTFLFLFFFATDLLFLESSEVVFRVALKLLEIHQDELMKRDNFEDIMNYMKTNVTDIDASTMDKIMKDVFTMDIRKQLIEYQVEYNVLQEEISTSQHYMETLNREKENYSQLESKLQV